MKSLTQNVKLNMNFSDSKDKDKQNIEECNASKLYLEYNSLFKSSNFRRPRYNNMTMEKLVASLKRTLNKKDNYLEPTVFSTVQILLEDYNGPMKDYEKYVSWNDNMYTRNLVCRTEFFTMMLLCWPKNICSPVHDHGGSQCWLKILEGDLEEQFYIKKPKKPKTPKTPKSKEAEVEMEGQNETNNIKKDDENDFEIQLVSKNVKSSPSICFINDDQGLHSISALNKRAVSLHIYVPGYTECHAFCKNGNDFSKKTCSLSFNTIDGKPV